MASVRPGELIDERFELIEEVGAGGMGVVYRARDLLNGELVAVKLLSTGSPKLGARLLHEAGLLRDLDHPSIVAYVAHGQAEGGAPYLVMEWIEGESLEDRLVRGPLTVDETLSLASAVTSGLGAVHRSGLVHRDVKPDNIFLVGGRLDAVKLLDFGVAGEIGDASRLDWGGRIVGTPLFMSPEQVQDAEHIDARADVFALGCVLYECLTGSPPFEGATIAAILAKILFADAPPPSSHDRAIEAPIDRLVLELLAKSPAARPADGEAVARRLARLGDETGRGAQRVEVTLSSMERRVVSVIMGSAAPDERGAIAADPRATLTFADVADAYELARVALEGIGDPLLMADGTVVLLLSQPGALVDCASRACHGALQLAAALPPAGRVAVATGLANSALGLPIGEAIERVSELLVHGAADHRVIIDEATANLVEARFRLDPRGDRSGLVRERDRTRVDRLLLGKPTPTFGREEELRLLRDTIQRTIEGSEARAMHVTGEAGIGKSRLRYELVRELARTHPALRVWTARPSGASKGAPFSMAAAVMRDALSIHAGQPSEEQLDALRNRFEAGGAPLDEETIALVSHLLGLGSALPHAASLAADAKLRFSALRRAWLEWLAVECEAGPVMLVLEDVHGVDDESIQLIDAALHVLGNRPLIAFALGRQRNEEGSAPLWSERDVTHLALRPMSVEASSALVRAVLEDKADEALVAELVTRAGGNVFFLEELLRHSVMGGTSSAGTPLAIVQSRLDALAPEERRFLRAASVFGVRAWLGGVAALSGTSMRDADALLERLAQSELVQEALASRFAGERELVFRHELLRDAAYEMLTGEDRRLGHQLATAWLEATGEQDPQVLAEHIERGADDDEALMRAAEQWRLLAERTVLGDDRVRFTARARGLIERTARAPNRDEVLLSARVAHCRALLWAGRNAAAIDELEDVLRLAEPRSTSPAALACQSMLAFAHAFAGRIEEAKEHSRRAEAIVGPFVTPTIECEGLTRRAMIAWHDGDADGAIEASRQQVSTAAEAGLVREVAVGAHNAGDACAKIGRYGEAIEWLERSSAAAMQIGYDSLIAQNERVLGFVEAWWLDEPRGRERIVRALEIAEAGAYQWDEFQARHTLALVDAKRGEVEAARAAFAELERDAERVGHEAAAREARAAIAAIDRGELPSAAI